MMVVGLILAVLCFGAERSVAASDSKFLIVIGDDAGRTLSTGVCVILIGDGVDVPSPDTSYYINIDGKAYPNSARSEPWLQRLVRERAHDMIRKMRDDAFGGGYPRFIATRQHAHAIIDNMSFHESECRGPVA